MHFFLHSKVFIETYHGPVFLLGAGHKKVSKSHIRPCSQLEYANKHTHTIINGGRGTITGKDGELPCT